MNPKNILLCVWLEETLKKVSIILAYLEVRVSFVCDTPGMLCQGYPQK